jgi:deoxyadenosine/deoxycytidine kinase
MQSSVSSVSSSVPPSSPLIISVEGNIGAGKSTLLHYLQKKVTEIVMKSYSKKMNVLQEPVDVWNTVCDENNQNILTKYYEDPEKYSFPFQILAYTTRLSLIQNELNKKESDVIVCERSLDADKNIFAKMLFDDNKIEYINYQIYNRLYQDTAITANCIIYLDTTPDICMKRIQKRNRTGEDKIQIEYLAKCKQYYDDWLIHNNAYGIPVLHINVDEEIDYNDKNLHENNDNIKKIIRFIVYHSMTSG